MSSELTVYLHKIGEKIEEDNIGRNNLIHLVWFSTTPTRELYDILPATYYGEENPDPIYAKYYRVLTPKTIAEIHDYYNNKIKEFNDILEENNKKIADNNVLIVKCVSLDILKALREENSSLEDYNSECKDSIEQYENLNRDFSFAEEVLEENNGYSCEEKVYELVYDMD
jgi:hypothetical protein